MKNDFLQSAIKQFEYYKSLADKTIASLSDVQLFWQYNQESNSIAIIANHLAGNMLSRWTDFLITDGEKDWRNREEEFQNIISTKNELLEKWNKGWNCLFTALNSLSEKDFDRIIYIINQGHSITEAINRQLCHYAYHVGQIVYIGKMIMDNNWKSLSIPKGNSTQYNQEKFSQSKEKRHFTDEFLTQ